MSFLKRLFGGGSAAASPASSAVEAEDYEGHAIRPAPMRADGQWRLSAEVSKTIDGETRVHKVIRADLFPTEEDASRYAVAKAKQVIDENGDRLYGV